MFGIGLPEFILIMALALIVVGPDKLPGLAKTVAKQVLELKKAANSLKDSLQEELAEEKESLKELSRGLEDVDISLTSLASANTPDEAELSPPGLDEEAAAGESSPETDVISEGQNKESADAGDPVQPVDGQTATKEPAAKA